MFSGPLKRKLSSGNLDSPDSGARHLSKLTDEEFMTQRHPKDPKPNHSSAPTTNQNPHSLHLNKPKVFIDLTADPPSPESQVATMAPQDLTGHFAQAATACWSTHEYIDEDFRLAMDLQAKLDAEDTDDVQYLGSASVQNGVPYNSEWKPKSSSKLPGDAIIQNPFAQNHLESQQDEFGAQPFSNSIDTHPASDYHHMDLMKADAEIARILQAEFDAEPTNPMDTDANQEAQQTSGTGPLASSMEADQEKLYQFSQAIYSLRCCQCNSPHFHNLAQLVKSINNTLEIDKSITSNVICRFCKVMTCVGCGKHTQPESMYKRATSSISLVWHCDLGRTFIAWALLCMPLHPKESTANDGRRKLRERIAVKVKPQQMQKSGVGYGGEARKKRGESTQFELKDDASQDNKLLPILMALQEVIPSWQKESNFDIRPDQALIIAMFHRSAFLDKAAELLRNDSIDNITKRKMIYHPLISFMQTLSSHSATARLVFEERTAYPARHGLMNISYDGSSPLIHCSDIDEFEKSQSLAKIMSNLTKQALAFSRQAAQNSAAIGEDEEAQDSVMLCDHIVELGNYLAANSNWGQEQSYPTDNKAKGRESNNVVGLDIEEWHREHCAIDVPDDTILAYHHFAIEVNKCQGSAKGRMKKLLMEVTSFQTSLPPGIYVRYGSSRLDVMKFLIIGPKGTPYENGIFEFDMFCPANFPNEPPKVWFKTTGKGAAHFNPNLYRDGKVCLSLIGTWSGEPWRPGQSTLLQVLVSIQSMVFCDEPWGNEPGRELSIGTAESHRYNHAIRKLTLEHALIPWARQIKDNEQSIWSEVVNKHFLHSVDQILYTTGRWVKDAKGASNAVIPYPGVVPTLAPSIPPKPSLFEAPPSQLLPSAHLHDQMMAAQSLKSMAANLTSDYPIPSSVSQHAPSYHPLSNPGSSSLPSFASHLVAPPTPVAWNTYYSTFSPSPQSQHISSSGPSMGHQNMLIAPNGYWAPYPQPPGSATGISPGLIQPKAPAQKENTKNQKLSKLTSHMKTKFESMKPKFPSTPSVAKLNPWDYPLPPICFQPQFRKKIPPEAFTWMPSSASEFPKTDKVPHQVCKALGMAVWDIEVVTIQTSEWEFKYPGPHNESELEAIKGWMWEEAKGKASVMHIDGFPVIKKPLAAPPGAFDHYEDDVFLDSDNMDETDSLSSAKSSADFSAEEFAMAAHVPSPPGQWRLSKRKGVLATQDRVEELAKLLEWYPRGRLSEKELEEGYKAHIMDPPLRSR